MGVGVPWALMADTWTQPPRAVRVGTPVPPPPPDPLTLLLARLDGIHLSVRIPAPVVAFV